MLSRFDACLKFLLLAHIAEMEDDDGGDSFDSIEEHWNSLSAAQKDAITAASAALFRPPFTDPETETHA